MQGPAEQRRAEILFADDDPFYRELATATLEEAGYTVANAVNGLAAMSALAERPFRLAIIDLEMPGMNGFELIARVRAEGCNRAMPIIVLTGHDNEASVEHAYKAGATSFLVKPVNWQLFVQHVRFVLKAAQSELELREASHTAQFLSDLKSRVLSTLVNEFHHPLRGAFVGASLLKHEADGPIASPMYRQAAADLYKTIEQLGTVHLKMLSFGRVLGDSIALEETQWPLGQVIVEAVEALREQADRRQVVLHPKIAIGSDVEMRGDRALVGQTLKGILATAIRFAPRRSTIGIEARIDPDGRFQFAVTDAAPTLTSDQIQEALALPAPQKAKADEGLDRTSLTIGRLLIEAHQGVLAIEPLAENGNVAKVTIPAVRIVAFDKARDPRQQTGRSIPIAVKQAGQQRLNLAVPHRSNAATT